MQALRWAWSVSTPATCKLVLARLADMADGAGACWPSLGRIANDTGLTERGARKALAELERRGLLRRDMRQASSTIYRLEIASAEGEEHGSARNDVPPHPEQCSSSPGIPFPPTRNGIPEGEEHGSARTLIQPSVEPSKEPALRADVSVATSLPPDARKIVWTDGLQMIQRITGKPAGAARSLMGKILKAAGDDCAAVLTVIRECPESGDPIAWLMAAARKRGGAKQNAMSSIRDDWNLPSLIDTGFMDDEETPKLRLVG